MSRIFHPPLTPTQLAKGIGISTPYASQLLSGARPLRRKMALRIFDLCHVRLGPIATATDAEIEVLRRYETEDAG